MSLHGMCHAEKPASRTASPKFARFIVLLRGSARWGGSGELVQAAVASALPVELAEEGVARQHARAHRQLVLVLLRQPWAG